VKAITPVHLGDNGASVSNLHKALLFLIWTESIEGTDRQSLKEQLAPEMHPETFGQATFRIVKIFQQNLDSHVGIDFPKDLKAPLPNGDVDEITAKALNWLLRKRGALR